MWPRSQGQLASPPCLPLKLEPRWTAAPPQATTFAAASPKRRAILVISRRTVPAGNSGQICCNSLEKAAEGRAHHVWPACLGPRPTSAPPSAGRQAPPPTASPVSPAPPGPADSSRTRCFMPLLSAFVPLCCPGRPEPGSRPPALGKRLTSPQTSPSIFPVRGSLPLPPSHYLVNFPTFKTLTVCFQIQLI